MPHGWEHLKDEDRDLILEGIRQGRVLGGPFHAELDPVDTCNVNCFFCGSADLHNGKILPWERMSRLLDELIAGGLRSVRLSGGGESTIYPQFDQLCDRLAEADVVIDQLTTNGVRLDKVMDALLLPRLHSVRVSLNYVNAEQYGRYMRTAPQKFDAVLKNTQMLHDRLVAEGRRGDALIHTQFFIHRGTVEDIPAMKELALQMPVDSVTISVIGGIPEEEQLRPRDIERVKELLPDVVKAFAGKTWLELELGLVGIQEFGDNLITEMRGADHPQAQREQHLIEYCYIAWYSMAVLGSGDVHACCFLMPDESVPPLGNVNGSTLAEIWDGPMYRKMREEMRSVMLLGEPAPNEQKQFVCTVPGCWKHDACPLAFAMADKAFYQRAHAELEMLRRRSGVRLQRLASKATRKLTGLRGG